MSRNYPEPPAPLPERPRPTLPDPFYRPERQWNVLQVAALIIAVEAVCFLALLWGQGWRP